MLHRIKKQDISQHLNVWTRALDVTWVIFPPSPPMTLRNCLMKVCCRSYSRKDFTSIAGTSFAVQWLRLQDSSAETGLIPAQELRTHKFGDMAFPHFIHLDWCLIPNGKLYLLPDLLKLIINLQRLLYVTLKVILAARSTLGHECVSSYTLSKTKDFPELSVLTSVASACSFFLYNYLFILSLAVLGVCCCCPGCL